MLGKTFGAKPRHRVTGQSRLGVLLIAVLLVAAACGDDDEPTATTAPGVGSANLLADLQAAGTIVGGISNEVPYGFEDASGLPTGIAPEVAKVILGRIGIAELTSEVVEFGALIPGLQAGRYDIIAGGMFINPERAQQILFSDPLFCGATAFMVAGGNPFGLSDFASIVGTAAVLGVVAGGVEEGYARDSGIPEDQLSVFADPPSVYDALGAGRVDAVSLDEVTGNANVASVGANFEVLPGFVPVVNGEEQLGCGGFGFTDQELRDAFNAQLRIMHSNNEILPIVAQFGVGASSVAKAAELTAEDLSTPKAQAAGLLADLQAAGTIVGGISNEVPYGFEDASGLPTGIAPEVAKVILGRIGIAELTSEVVEFGALIPGLQAGRYDIIAGGMFINPERAQQILFSDPLFCGATAFMVAGGNPFGLSDFASIVGTAAVLGVVAGGVEEGYARDSGIPEDQLSVFADPPSVYDALGAGRVDAVSLDEVTGNANVASVGANFEVLPGFVPVVNGEEQLGCGGFGFTDQELRDAFNAQLRIMHSNNEILPIVAQFGVGASSVAKAAELTAEDLSTPKAQAAGLLADLQAAGTIVGGISNEVPYGFEDASGLPTGIAPEVAKVILGRIGIAELTSEVVEFGALIPGLQAGRYDIIAGGMFINPERAQQILFSDPLFCGATAFMVAGGNPFGLSDFASIVGTAAVLGVVAGGVEEGYARDSGIPEDQLSVFADPPSVYDALGAGRVDAVSLDEVTGNANVASVGANFEVLPGFVPVVNGEEQLGCGGFGFTDQELRDAFNAQLRIMHSNNEILPIVAQFGVGASSVAKAAELTAEDLSS